MALDVQRAAFTVLLFQALYWVAHVVSKHSFLSYKYTVLAPDGVASASLRVPARRLARKPASRGAWWQRAGVACIRCIHPFRRVHPFARALTVGLVRRRSEPMVPVRVLFRQGRPVCWKGEESFGLHACRTYCAIL
jgi:hypothetical protein